MAGFKDFADGNVLTAPELDSYLMRQSVMRFPSSASLLAALPNGIRELGMLAWSDADQTLYRYNGAGVWMPEASTEKAFTPVWQGPTSLAIGNGTLTCRWRYAGGKVFAHYELVRGSTTNVGTTSYAWTLPVAAASGNHAIGQGVYRDASPLTEYGLTIVPTTSTTIVALLTASNVRASNAAPVTPATSDQYFFDCMYEPQDGIS